MAFASRTAGQTLTPAALVRIEAHALEALAHRLDHEQATAFENALRLLELCLSQNHRILVSGIGKSGLIARKIAATLCSTGAPAHFLHATDALHGDLGVLAPGDVLLVLSASGATREILDLLPALEQRHTPVIALCGVLTSPLALSAQITLDTSVSAEACPFDLAPTASTAVMLALGDALALTLSVRRGFSPRLFADLHPGGHLGRRLSLVRDLMHAGAALPAVAPSTPMAEVIYEMSRKQLGMTTVLGPGTPRPLLGMVSDGDLRRLLERDGAHALDHTAADIMNPTPVTIAPETFAADALALMEQRRITSLIVVSDHAEVLGIVHIHDLWNALGPASARTLP